MRNYVCLCDCFLLYILLFNVNSSIQHNDTHLLGDIAIANAIDPAHCYFHVQIHLAWTSSYYPITSIATIQFSLPVVQYARFGFLLNLCLQDTYVIYPPLLCESKIWQHVSWFCANYVIPWLWRNFLDLNVTEKTSQQWRHMATLCLQTLFIILWIII